RTVADGFVGSDDHQDSVRITPGRTPAIALRADGSPQLGQSTCFSVSERSALCSNPLDLLLRRVRPTGTRRVICSSIDRGAISSGVGSLATHDVALVT